MANSTSVSGAVPAHPRSRPVARGRGWRRMAIGLAVVVVVLLLAQLAGSWWATRYVNARLADMPEYTGKVGSVHLIPWGVRGTVRNFMLWRRGHEEAGPIISVRTAAFDAAFLKLLGGKLSGDATLDTVDVRLVRDGPPEKKEEEESIDDRLAAQRVEQVRRWQVLLRESFPVELRMFELTNGKVRVEDRTEGAESAVELSGMHLIMKELTTDPAEAEDRPAEAQLQATVAGSGKLQLSVQADPRADAPDFEARMELRELQVVDLRSYLRTAAKVDVMAGTFEVYVEVDAKDGAYQGYLKPFFRDLEFEPVKDPTQGPLRRVAGEVADAVTQLLKNDEEKVATKAPFQGNFADNKVDVWTTVENLLRNAFVQSLREGLEGQPAGGTGGE